MSTRMNLAVASVLWLCAVPAYSQPTLDLVTVPLIVEGNRPYVDVVLQGPTGVVRTGRFVLDSGGGDFLIAEPLARDLGLVWGETFREDGRTFGRIDVPPRAAVGDFQLELNPARVDAVLGTDRVLAPAAPGRADGLIPGWLLARYHVVFDYPAGRFTLAHAGVLTPKGRAFPMPVSTEQGFPRTEVTVDGVVYGFLIDTGASFTMVSEELLKKLGAAHPEWPRYSGAVGDATTLGGQTLETMVVPRASWVGQLIAEFGIVSQPAGTFERYMSGMMKAPIVGSLAGNVLKHFRLDLDYPNEKLYLSSR